jgi:hypothetical protein
MRAVRSGRFIRVTQCIQLSPNSTETLRVRSQGKPLTIPIILSIRNNTKCSSSRLRLQHALQTSLVADGEKCRSVGSKTPRHMRHMRGRGGFISNFLGRGWTRDTSSSITSLLRRGMLASGNMTKIRDRNRKQEREEQVQRRFRFAGMKYLASMNCIRRRKWSNCGRGRGQCKTLRLLRSGVLSSWLALSHMQGTAHRENTLICCETKRGIGPARSHRQSRQC